MQEGQEKYGAASSIPPTAPPASAALSRSRGEMGGRRSAPKGSRTPVTTLKEWCPYR